MKKNKRGLNSTKPAPNWIELNSMVKRQHESLHSASVNDALRRTHDIVALYPASHACTHTHNRELWIYSVPLLLALMLGRPTQSSISPLFTVIHGPPLENLACTRRQDGRTAHSTEPEPGRPATYCRILINPMGKCVGRAGWLESGRAFATHCRL